MYEPMTPFAVFFEHLGLMCDEYEQPTPDEPEPELKKVDVIRRFRRHEVIGGRTDWVRNDNPWMQAEEAAVYCYEGGAKPQWMIDLEGHRD